MPRTYRVVVVRTGSDLEQMQADGVARALRDVGFEVIYAPPSAGLDQLAAAVLQEDADAVGLALAGRPADLTDLRADLASRGIEDVLAFAIEGDPGELAAEVWRGLGVDGDS